MMDIQAYLRALESAAGGSDNSSGSDGAAEATPYQDNGEWQSPDDDHTHDIVYDEDHDGVIEVDFMDDPLLIEGDPGAWDENGGFEQYNNDGAWNDSPWGSSVFDAEELAAKNDILFVVSFISDSWLSGEAFLNRQMIGHFAHRPYRGRWLLLEIGAGSHDAVLTKVGDDRARLAIALSKENIHLNLGRVPAYFPGVVQVSTHVSNGRKSMSAKGEIERGIAQLLDTFPLGDSVLSIACKKFDAATEFFYPTDRTSFYRMSGTTWLPHYKGNLLPHVRYDELFRDDRFIYLKVTGGGLDGRYVRWALHGGGFWAGEKGRWVYLCPLTRRY